MGKKNPLENQSIESVIDRLKELETRISTLENLAEFPMVAKSALQPEIVQDSSIKAGNETETIESKVGEYGMAWIGNIVLLFGIIFLLQFLKSQGLSLFSSIFGLVSVAAVYLSASLLRKHFPYMSNLFGYNGHLLLFIVTLRLHFTSSDPLISNYSVGLTLLVLVISVLLYLGYRNKSQILTSIVLLMITITAILSNSTPFMLGFMVVTAGISVFYVYKYSWWRLLILSIFCVYTCFLMWSLNNPVITHTFRIVESIQFSYLYLFACSFIYSMLALLPARDKNDEQVLNVSIILNGLGFTFIITLLAMKFFKENYYIPFSIISAFGIAYSALLQSRGEWKLSAALYALYGFTMLSISIAGIYKFPLAFLLLAFESLLVVSMALWFHSRFIVLMNVVMYISLLTAYFVSSEPLSRIDFAFALVALISARVINWKKNRLEIKTEWMRNIYLFLGFLMTLVSLYRAVPVQYITLSWTLAAVTFFILSILIHNVKYRWLAIGTMIVTSFYFFMFDLRQISLGYRIVALLFLAIISLSFSIFYSRRMKKQQQNSPGNH